MNKDSESVFCVACRQEPATAFEWEQLWQRDLPFDVCPRCKDKVPQLMENYWTDRNIAQEGQK